MNGILVDLDGVLWFSEKVHKESFIRVFQQFIPNAQSLIENTWLFGESTEQYISRLLNRLDIPIDKYTLGGLVEAKRLYAFEAVDIPINFLLIKALNQVRKLDVSIALVSSSSKANTEKFIDMSKSANIFDCVVNSSHVVKSKPYPDCYNYAMNELKLSPLRCTAIEDSQIGLESAKKAGIANLLCYPKDFETFEYEQLLVSLITRAEG